MQLMQLMGGRRPGRPSSCQDIKLSHNYIDEIHQIHGQHKTAFHAADPVLAAAEEPGDAAGDD